MPYARNVHSEHRFASLPEPGLVFDALLKARDVSDIRFTSLPSDVNWTTNRNDYIHRALQVFHTHLRY